MFHNQSSEADAARTIALSRKDMLAARRLLRLLLGVDREASKRRRQEPPTRREADVGRTALIARAREEFENRRRRIATFGQSMFGEPAWDMLLALYILDVSGQRQTIGSLLDYSGTPPTTAKRWLDFLYAHDLVRREPHPTDRRTAFISLTAKAREKLDLFYSETVATGM